MNTCLYSLKPKIYFKKIYFILFLLILIFTPLVYNYGSLKFQSWFFISCIIILVNYFETINQKYSIYLVDNELVIRNEYLFFKNERFRINLDNINNIDFRFSNSPILGSIHLIFNLKANNSKKIKLNENYLKLEKTLLKIKQLKINLKFLNIQTSEQRKFAIDMLQD